MNTTFEEKTNQSGSPAGASPNTLPARIIQTVKDKVKYRLILQSFSDLLERFGIAIIPFYTYEESIADNILQNLPLEAEISLKQLRASFLTHSEIELLCALPECAELALDREKLLTDQCRCFALKQEGQIVSYMLCNFYECDSRLLSFRLNDDEVYLTGAYTFNGNRGKNLAALTEYELYKCLYDLGRTKYHSINILYNTPGLKFKQKLHAQPASLRIFISLFNRFKWTCTLREFPH